MNEKLTDAQVALLDTPGMDQVRAQQYSIRILKPLVPGQARPSSAEQTVYRQLVNVTDLEIEDDMEKYIFVSMLAAKICEAKFRGHTVVVDALGESTRFRRAG